MSEAVPERFAGLSPERRILLQRMLLERAGAGGSAQEIRPREGGGPAPLSFAQQRLWFIDRMEPGSPAYNIPHVLLLRGELDVRALRRALAETVRRQESLRTVFALAGDEPVQTVLPAGPVRLPVADLRALPEAHRAGEARALLDAERSRAFDLARGPLFRALLVRMDEDDWRLALVVHHVVSDGWSTGILTREVSALYAAFRAGEASPLPPLPVQYADFAVWQRELLSGERLEEQVAWWRARLAGAPPVLDLPTDRPRPARPSAAGGACAVHLSADAARATRELARETESTPFMVLLAGWQALLGRYAGEEDVSVGTVVAGRPRRELEGVVGFFVNTLVMRTDLSGDPTVRELMGRVRETVLGAFAHQEVPFEKLVEELAPERSLRHTPFFQAMLSLNNTERGDLRLGELQVASVGTDAASAKFDLSLGLVDDGERISGALSFRSELFDAATAARMVERWERLLAAMAAAPGARVWELELLAPEERDAVLRASRAPAEAPAPAATLHARFAEAAARAPAAPALLSGGDTLTYAGLARRAGAIAAELRARGVVPEARVGVCLEWSPELVAALLGVLQAGGVYVPLDPAYPVERLAWIAADAGVSVLVTDARLAERVARFGVEVVVVDAPGESDGVEEADSVSHSRTPALSHSPFPENLAYVVYTSGSTGTPRGVAVEHRAAAEHFRAFARTLGIGPGDRVLQFAAPGFDVALEQVLVPLLAGAALVLRGPEAWTPAAWPARVRELGITVANLAPAFWREVVEAAEDVELPGLRVMAVGADVMPSDAVRAWRGRVRTPARLLNVYGPTEAVVSATVHALPAGFPDAGAGASAPIGAPLPGRAAYVLDARGEPSPPGVPGELYLGGALLARGYAGRPDATAARFVPDPFAGEPGARLYRTGDRVRRLPCGALEFLGRTDAQVKVRGFRVEPGEVEAALRGHPGVRDALVAARGEGAERRLVGWFVPADGASPAAAELRGWLRARLPEHMVPAAFAPLDAVPLTPTGKPDRRALPDPDAIGGEAEPAAPSTETEERIAGIFAAVLGRERVGVHDDFFALGGHSLLAARVIARIEAALAVEVPLRAFFERPTVAALAEWVDEHTADALEEWEVRAEMEMLSGLSDEEVRRLLAEED
jgi:amino acid adenylation domain-containing protein